MTTCFHNGVVKMLEKYSVFFSKFEALKKALGDKSQESVVRQWVTISTLSSDIHSLRKEDFVKCQEEIEVFLIQLLETNQRQGPSLRNAIGELLGLMLLNGEDKRFYKIMQSLISNLTSKTTFLSRGCLHVIFVLNQFVPKLVGAYLPELVPTFIKLCNKTSERLFVFRSLKGILEQCTPHSLKNTNEFLKLVKIGLNDKTAAVRILVMECVYEALVSCVAVSSPPPTPQTGSANPFLYAHPVHALAEGVYTLFAKQTCLNEDEGVGMACGRLLGFLCARFSRIGVRTTAPAVETQNTPTKETKKGTAKKKEKVRPKFALTLQDTTDLYLSLWPKSLTPAHHTGLSAFISTFLRALPLDHFVANFSDYLFFFEPLKNDVSRESGYTHHLLTTCLSEFLSILPEPYPLQVCRALQAALLPSALPTGNAEIMEEGETAPTDTPGAPFVLSQSGGICLLSPDMALVLVKLLTHVVARIGPAAVPEAKSLIITLQGFLLHPSPALPRAAALALQCLCSHHLPLLRLGLFTATAQLEDTANASADSAGIDSLLCGYLHLLTALLPLHTTFPHAFPFAELSSRVFAVVSASFEEDKTVPDQVWELLGSLCLCGDTFFRPNAHALVKIFDKYLAIELPNPLPTKPGPLSLFLKNCLMPLTCVRLCAEAYDVASIDKSVGKRFVHYCLASLNITTALQSTKARHHHTVSLLFDRLKFEALCTLGHLPSSKRVSSSLSLLYQTALFSALKRNHCVQASLSLDVPENLHSLRRGAFLRSFPPLLPQTSAFLLMQNEAPLYPTEPCAAFPCVGDTQGPAAFGVSGTVALANVAVLTVAHILAGAPGPDRLKHLHELAAVVKEGRAKGHGSHHPTLFNVLLICALTLQFIHRGVAGGCLCAQPPTPLSHSNELVPCWNILESFLSDASPLIFQSAARILTSLCSSSGVRFSATVYHTCEAQMNAIASPGQRDLSVYLPSSLLSLIFFFFAFVVTSFFLWLYFIFTQQVSFFVKDIRKKETKNDPTPDCWTFSPLRLNLSIF
eukprot:GCRY01003214.1.p1 GENE.GCRY01003214.1~~GCRY01003214.1.p1  ORF type:complete len:1029 (+),score=222.16 GCRY01003214.1:280-3366(+)